MRDTSYIKNHKMSNKRMLFKEEIIKANEVYKNRGLALVQKISTPWQVVRKGKKIISAFPVQRSTLDFRGTIKPGISISFDCKESEDEKGLPLKYIHLDGDILKHDIEDWPNMIATLGKDWGTIDHAIENILDDDFAGWNDLRKAGRQISMFEGLKMVK